MKRFHLSEERERKIVKEIRRAEKQTSGEIRVHISFRHEEDHYHAAVWTFHKLKMDETAEKNGVLFYVCAKDRAFVIIGDEGIDKVVPEEFWEDIKRTLIRNFKKKRYVRGLRRGIRMTGEALKKYFPYSSNDKNELPDEISRD